MLAARAGSASLLTAFLSLSASPAALLSATDIDGSTALHFASAHGHLKCVLTLLQAGASHAARNAFSWTPVDYSSTVSAEVYFKNLVAEMETRRSAESQRAVEMGRRRDGGVRVVDREEDWEGGGGSLAREVLGGVDAGRTTPTGLRAQGWGLGGRVRAGSAE